MEIALQQLDRFRALCRQKCGIELTPKEALKSAIALLTLMKATYRPLTDVDFMRIKERQALLSY